MAVTNATGQVRCVVRTVAPTGMQQLVRLPGNAQLAATPWHPIRVRASEPWTFPVHVGVMAHEPCEAVYNFVLASGHVMLIGGVECATLAHGVTGDVREHAYWGTQAVLDDLRAMPGWQAGYVTIGVPQTLRDADTGLVCRLLDRAAAASAM